MPKMPTSKINHWINITDFTAGCYNYSNISNSGSVVPAQPGAADARYTVGCMALTKGGLGPLPKVVKSFDYPVADATVTTKFYITGLASIPVTGHQDAIVSIAEAWKTPNHKLLRVLEQYTTNTTSVTLINHLYTTTTNSFFGSPFPTMTRMAASTPTTTPGHPTIIFPTSVPGLGSGTGQLWQYPNVTAPTSTTPKTIVKTGITGQVVVHNSRVITLVGIGYTMGITQISVNENLGYTTPGNSQTYLTAMLVLSPQYPYGYGCAGSISAGELFLVKKRGGGIILSGDVTSPSVINLPGVQSTGDFYGNCAQTPAGLFYCSTSEGAWLWNGGNLSSKVSQNLTDDFFVCANVVPNCNNLGFYCQTWGEWVLFSNSWVFNIRQQSWWKLQEPTLFHYQPSRTSRYMYASPQVVENGTAKYMYMFDKNTPVTQWTWQTLPNRLEQNRFINIREIVLYTSNPSNGSSKYTVTIFNETTDTFNFTTTPATSPIGSDPSMIRIATGGINLFNAIVRIEATGDGSAAPILHGVTIGCTTTHHAGPTQ